MQGTLQNTIDAMEYEILALLESWWNFILIFSTGYFPIVVQMEQFREACAMYK